MVTNYTKSTWHQQTVSRKHLVHPVVGHQADNFTRQRVNIHTQCPAACVATSACARSLALTAPVHVDTGQLRHGPVVGLLVSGQTLQDIHRVSRMTQQYDGIKHDVYKCSILCRHLQFD